MGVPIGWGIKVEGINHKAAIAACQELYVPMYLV